MDKVRVEEHAAWEINSVEMVKGLDRVKLALKVLNEYCTKVDKAHDVVEGARTGVMGPLEVCESDFAKGLAEMNVAEEFAHVAYEQETKENGIEKTTKEQDVKYKTKGVAGLHEVVAELSSDREDVVIEFAAAI